MSSPTRPLTDVTSVACCNIGALHDGEPNGRIEKIEGVDSYIASPATGIETGNVIVYFPDVHGFYKNAFLIMDAMAEMSGCLVLGIDYFDGDPVWKSTNAPFNDPNFDPMKWQDEHMPFSKDVTPRWIEAVRQKYGNEGKAKFACVGYCWGAPFVCEQLSSAGSCVAGAFAHPANLEESHFLELEKPLLMSLAENDFLFDRDQRDKAVTLLEEKGKTFQLQLFSRVSHGFALRGDMSDPYQKFVKEQSLGSIVKWLSYYLSV